MQEPAGLVIIAEFKVKPGKLAEFLAAAGQHARNSLRNEPGCLQFDVVQDSAAPDRVLMYEVYRDAAAFDAHQESEHLARMRPILQELVAERVIHKLDRVAHPTKGGNGRGKVLVSVGLLRNRLDLVKPLEEAGFEIIVPPEARILSEDELIAQLPGCVATIAGTEPYTDRVFTAAPDLQVVARLGVGYDQIDLTAAQRHGVAIAMAFGTNHEAVADMTLTLMAAGTHRLIEYDAKIRRGEWGTFYHGRLHGTTVGIVGFGRIGRAVAKRCQGFNMQVLVADPIMDGETVARLGCHLVELDELVREADIVSIHCPRLPSTMNLIDRRRIGMMKPGSVLVNTARGGIVDEAALHDALVDNRLAAAGLDVFANEPLRNSPLTKLPNVVLTPHVAGGSSWAIEQMGRRCVENILAVTRGQDPGPGYLLNPEALTSGRPGAS